MVTEYKVVEKASLDEVLRFYQSGGVEKIQEEKGQVKIRTLHTFKESSTQMVATSSVFNIPIPFASNREFLTMTSVIQKDDEEIVYLIISSFDDLDAKGLVEKESKYIRGVKRGGVLFKKVKNGVNVVQCVLNDPKGSFSAFLVNALHDRSVPRMAKEVKKSFYKWREEKLDTET